VQYYGLSAVILIDVGTNSTSRLVKYVVHEYAHAHLGSPGHDWQFFNIILIFAWDGIRTSTLAARYGEILAKLASLCIARQLTDFLDGLFLKQPLDND
jgi:hypothetical protein